jgi:phage terminase large subunit-like protein
MWEMNDVRYSECKGSDQDLRQFYWCQAGKVTNWPDSQICHKMRIKYASKYIISHIRYVGTALVLPWYYWSYRTYQ